MKVDKFNLSTILFWFGYVVMLIMLAKCWFTEEPRIYHGYDEVVTQYYEPKN